MPHSEYGFEMQTGNCFGLMDLNLVTYNTNCYFIAMPMSREQTPQRRFKYIMNVNVVDLRILRWLHWSADSNIFSICRVKVCASRRCIINSVYHSHHLKQPRDRCVEKPMNLYQYYDLRAELISSFFTQNRELGSWSNGITT